jgi:hypothetical protein
VDDARTGVVANFTNAGTMIEQGAHQGSGFMTRPGVHDEAGRFIQDDHVPIFIQKGKGNWFGLTSDGFLRRDFGLDDISSLYQIPGFLDVSADGDMTGTNQPADTGAGECRQAGGNNGVKSVPGF